MEPEESGELAIFDTETDMFLTGVWSHRMLDKILRMWKRNHPEMNMTRFEYRPRGFTQSLVDRQSILIIDKATNIVVCYYHWSNKGYARAYEPETYKFVRYTAPQGLDITDIMDRNDGKLWGGKGEVLTEWRIQLPRDSESTP